MQTILDAVRRHATEKGDALAYWTPSRTWTFAQLWDTAGRAATGLAKQGIGPGDRVLVGPQPEAGAAGRAG